MVGDEKSVRLEKLLRGTNQYLRNLSFNSRSSSANLMKKWLRKRFQTKSIGTSLTISTMINLIFILRALHPLVEITMEYYNCY